MNKSPQSLRKWPRAKGEQAIGYWHRDPDSQQLMLVMWVRDDDGVIQEEFVEHGLFYDTIQKRMDERMQRYWREQRVLAREAEIAERYDRIARVIETGKP